jgi:hypothetical protein
MLACPHSVPLLHTLDAGSPEMQGNSSNGGGVPLVLSSQNDGGLVPPAAIDAKANITGRRATSVSLTSHLEGPFIARLRAEDHGIGTARA